MIVNFSQNITGLKKISAQTLNIGAPKAQGAFKNYNLSDSLNYMSEFNKSTLLNFKGAPHTKEERQRMNDELYFVVDKILEDVKEISSIYKKATRAFLKQEPEAPGRQRIVIIGNKMIEYTNNGRRETLFRDKKPVRIVEYNETKGKKNIIRFKNGSIAHYQEGIKENPSHYDGIDAEIFFEGGEPIAYLKDVLVTPEGKRMAMHDYRP